MEIRDFIVGICLIIISLPVMKMIFLFQKHDYIIDVFSDKKDRLEFIVQLIIFFILLGIITCNFM